MVTVGVVVSLLISIIIGVIIYFEVIDSVEQFNEATERFTGYTLPTGTHSLGGSNYTVTLITLTSSPYSIDNSTISVVCYNSTGHFTSSPAVGINGREITIPPSPLKVLGNPLGFNQINVTYTSNTARTQSHEVTPMASTVFSLLPIIALVVVASIILAYVLAFGGGTGNTGGGSGRKGGGV